MSETGSQLELIEDLPGAAGADERNRSDRGPRFPFAVGQRVRWSPERARPRFVDGRTYTVTAVADTVLAGVGECWVVHAKGSKDGRSIDTVWRKTDPARIELAE